MIRRLNEKIETALYRRGFVIADVRTLMRNQVWIFILTCALTGPLTLLSAPAALSFAAGTVLVSLNFYSLAKLGQQLVHVQKGAVLALLFRFYARLLLTGLVLYALIVWANADVFALLAGLSTVVLSAIIFGIHQVASRAAGKTAKEA